MKLFLALSFVFVASAANATSPYGGPYIAMTSVRSFGMGQAQPIKTVCTIKPHNVRIQRSNGPDIVREVGSNWQELEKAIRGASKQEYKRVRVYAKPANPRITIVAGIVSEQLNVKLLEDGGGMFKRQGQDAADLIRQAVSLCK